MYRCNARVKSRFLHYSRLHLCDTQCTQFISTIEFKPFFNLTKRSAESSSSFQHLRLDYTCKICKYRTSNVSIKYVKIGMKNLEPGKQEGVVYRIPCECGKVYIGETGRAMQDRIKEHDRDIRLAHTQTSAVSEHANETGHLPLWNQVKFIDRDPHRYTRRVKEAIQIRLHSNNINRDNGIEIPEAWMPTIRKHNSRSTTKRTPEGTSSASRNNEDRNTPITVNQRA